MKLQCYYSFVNAINTQSVGKIEFLYFNKSKTIVVFPHEVKILNKLRIINKEFPMK